MTPHLILRAHADLRLGLGHVARALAIEEAWRSLGGTATLAISGDERARRVGGGRHPFLDQPLALPAVDLGAEAQAPLPADLKARAQVVLVDQWDTTAAQIEALRPLRLAVLEDDTDAHEGADLLFQPFLEGVKWPEAPVKVVGGRKVRPCETAHGACRVLRGTGYAVVAPAAQAQRPRREPLQPLAVHRLLVTFGGSDGAGLAQRAHDVLARLAQSGRWVGTCTLLAPRGIEGAPFPGCTVSPGLPNLTRRLLDFDAIWCSAGVTLSETMCLGVPAATWGQNERQHLILGDLALHNGCFDLGIGPEADLDRTEEALAQWLGPEGLDNRQEQVRDGMALIDGLGASRIAQELWRLATQG
jgi:spore coat polysaccharide biosynthesis predicted glycosyltransferase SpsG